MCNEAASEGSDCCAEGCSHTAPPEMHCHHFAPHMPRGFIIPSILMLIGEEPSHGYLLLDRLKGMGVPEDGIDLNTVYRLLRQFEADGLAVSEVVDAGRGPARKVYRLTDMGFETLKAWSEHIDTVSSVMQVFQERFREIEKKD